MKSNDPDFKAWVDRLVQTCLPLDLQKKLLTLAPLTKEEARKFIDVIALASQAKQLGKQSDILDKLEALTRDSRRNGDLLRETLWHASGKLPQYKPNDKRSVNAVKEAMVQMAIDRILAGANASPRAILNAILGQYANIPGAYDSLPPFLRQVERVMKKSRHTL